MTSKLCGEVKTNCPGVPYILAALKIDLREDQETLEKIKAPPVSTEIGNTKASQIKAAKYIEVSSVNNVNVTELFDEAIRLVISPEKDKKGGSCCTIL